MKPLIATLTILATLVAATTLCAAAPDDAKDTATIRVLLVTGVDHPGHRWQQTGPVLRDLLQQDKRLKVEIVEKPEVLGTDALFDYDLLFLHFKNYKPLANQAQAKENLVKFVKQGKGLVAFHFACGAFEDWPEFGDLVGKVWDRKTGHDPRGPFSVKIVDREHAITRGMDDFQADDELYICLIGEKPVQVLATARSKVTGKDHPMAFVLSFGKGRVFHTPLGHDVKSIQMPGVVELTRRGCLWAAGHQP